MSNTLDRFHISATGLSINYKMCIRDRSTIEQMTQVQQEHEELCRTMEAGQSQKAEELIVEHLRRSEERYRGQKGENPDQAKI